MPCAERLERAGGSLGVEDLLRKLRRLSRHRSSWLSLRYAEQTLA
jgi:hypothetical protein